MSKTNKTAKNTKKATKTVKSTARRVRFADNARITVLPGGKTNPRREGSAPYKRYAVLLKSRTVGAFLKSQPKWYATISRAVKENRIKVR
jgi:hypothetical protein